MVREFLRPVVALAAKHRFALVCVIHFNKKDLGALDKISESKQFGAIARSIYVVGPNPDDWESLNRKAIAHAKSNVSRLSPSWSFHIEEISETHGRLQWGSRIDATAEDIVQGHIGGNDVRGTRSREAEILLTGVLRRGPYPSEKINALAAALNITERTLDAVKKKMGVKAKKQEGGEWWCYLPGFTEREEESCILAPLHPSNDATTQAPQ